MTRLRLITTGALTSLQDGGRTGYLAAGLSASGPMDRGAFVRARNRLRTSGETVLEFTAGLSFRIESGTIRVAADGGDFRVMLNGAEGVWPFAADLRAGDVVSFAPGHWGTWGILAFSGQVISTPVLGSRSTNTIAHLGGAILGPGDVVDVDPVPDGDPGPLESALPLVRNEGPLRVTPGLHADRFAPNLWQRFLSARFVVTDRRDRMGIRLKDPEAVFAGHASLSLVSEPVVAGDIQILGDGTPVVLMRDHQPVGGYPRLATVISADLDRLAQMRPGEEVRFVSVSVETAQRLLR